MLHKILGTACPFIATNRSKQTLNMSCQSPRWLKLVVIGAKDSIARVQSQGPIAYLSITAVVCLSLTAEEKAKKPSLAPVTG